MLDSHGEASILPDSVFIDVPSPDNGIMVESTSLGRKKRKRRRGSAHSTLQPEKTMLLPKSKLLSTNWRLMWRLNQKPNAPCLVHGY